MGFKLAEPTEEIFRILSELPQLDGREGKITFHHQATTQPKPFDKVESIEEYLKDCSEYGLIPFSTQFLRYDQSQKTFIGGREGMVGGSNLARDYRNANLPVIKNLLGIAEKRGTTIAAKEIQIRGIGELYDCDLLKSVISEFPGEYQLIEARVELSKTMRHGMSSPIDTLYMNKVGEVSFQTLNSPKPEQGIPKWFASMGKKYGIE